MTSDVACGLAAVVELDDPPAVLAADGLGVDAEAKVDPVALEYLGEVVADLGRFPLGEPLGALDERHAGAEAGEELRQFDADGAAADDDGALGDLGEVGRLAVRPVAGFGKAGDGGHDGLRPRWR